MNISPSWYLAISKVLVQDSVMYCGSPYFSTTCKMPFYEMQLQMNEMLSDWKRTGCKAWRCRTVFPLALLLLPSPFINLQNNNPQFKLFAPLPSPPSDSIIPHRTPWGMHLIVWTSPHLFPPPASSPDIFCCTYWDYLYVRETMELLMCSVFIGNVILKRCSLILPPIPKFIYLIAYIFLYECLVGCFLV